VLFLKKQNPTYKTGGKTMSAEKTLELLKKLKEDPKARELLDGLKKAASADEMISCFA
jgi:hypothetical protein